MASLTIQNVEKVYGDIRTLKKINIDVPDGEFLVLLGPSGCGKSTLLSAIAGLMPVTSGEIIIDGQVVNDVDSAERDIAMVFQSYALYPTMTVRKNLTFGMRVRGVKKADQEKAVDRVSKVLQLEHLLERRPAQLSGGQRQRVAMGRAMVRQPKVFLFDEPLSNLDAKLRTDMRAEIKKLHQRDKTTTIYVTHDQIEAMTLATKIVVMNGGEVQQIADPQTIYELPENLFVAKFIGSPAMNCIEGKLESSGGSVQFVAKEAPGLRITLDRTDLPLSDYLGKSVVLGIRPEWITAEVSNSGECLNTTVEIVEPTGSDDFVILSVGAQNLMARFNPGLVAAGEKLLISLDIKRVLVFDAETESRIS